MYVGEITDGWPPLMNHVRYDIRYYLLASEARTRRTEAAEVAASATENLDASRNIPAINYANHVSLSGGRNRSRRGSQSA